MCTIGLEFHYEKLLNRNYWNINQNMCYSCDIAPLYTWYLPITCSSNSFPFVDPSSNVSNLCDRSETSSIFPNNNSTSTSTFWKKYKLKYISILYILFDYIKLVGKSIGLLKYMSLCVWANVTICKKYLFPVCYSNRYSIELLFFPVSSNDTQNISS